MNDDTPRHRILTTRLEFLDALREGLAQIAAAGCREVWIADTDFADWPIGERAVVDSLTAWAMAHRKLTMLAQTYDAVLRRHARFVEWRRQWSHVIECRQLEELEPGEMPTLLLAPGVVTVRLFDREHVRGSVSHDPADAIRARELVDAISQRSSEAFPATTLGL